MSLMVVVAESQKGLLIPIVASFIGVEEPVARAALERLLTALARRLGERADDAIEQDVVLDVVAQGGFQRYLDDPRVLLGREAVRDGEEVLVYLYGSVDAARDDARAIGPPAGLDGEIFARLMTLAASLLLAALGRRLEQLAHPPAAGPATPWTDLGRAIVRGLVEGSLRTLRPRHASFRRRMEARRRRRAEQGPSGRPSLDQLLGDLLDDDASG